jgi:4-carboxymuconolactone decarboxylase
VSGGVGDYIFTMSHPLRIKPLSNEELDEAQHQLLASVGGLAEPEHNIFRTLIRYPRLFRRWSQVGGILLSGLLPLRDRELLVLRTAYLCDSEYVWHQHARIALECGVTRHELARIRLGSVDEDWDPFESALLHAADELHRGGTIEDGGWEVLSTRYNDRQLIEVCMLVGHYHLIAFTLNSLGVQVETL